MTTHTLLPAVLMVLSGCSSGAALELAQAIPGEERSALRALISAGATLETARGTVTGQEAVTSALSALPRGGRASGHHDVARLALPDALLFAMGADTVQVLALFEGVGADALPGALVDYVAAWNTPDDAERERRLGAFAVSGRYVDPTVDAVGREAFAAHLAAFRASRTGTTFELTGGIRRAGEWLAFDWIMTSGGTATPGTDVVRLDEDGRVALVAGFF